jgi:hypothetical protein
VHCCKGRPARVGVAVRLTHGGGQTVQRDLSLGGGGRYNPVDDNFKEEDLKLLATSSVCLNVSLQQMQCA